RPPVDVPVRVGGPGPGAGVRVRRSHLDRGVSDAPLWHVGEAGSPGSVFGPVVGADAAGLGGGSFRAVEFRPGGGLGVRQHRLPDQLGSDEETLVDAVSGLSVSDTRRCGALLSSACRTRHPARDRSTVPPLPARTHGRPGRIDGDLDRESFRPLSAALGRVDVRDRRHHPQRPARPGAGTERRSPHRTRPPAPGFRCRPHRPRQPAPPHRHHRLAHTDRRQTRRPLRIPRRHLPATRRHPAGWPATPTYAGSSPAPLRNPRPRKNPKNRQPRGHYDSGTATAGSPPVTAPPPGATPTTSAPGGNTTPPQTSTTSSSAAHTTTPSSTVPSQLSCSVSGVVGFDGLGVVRYRSWGRCQLMFSWGRIRLYPWRKVSTWEARSSAPSMSWR